MAKDKSEKKEKRKSVDGVKKEKKEKRKSTSNEKATALLNEVEDAVATSVAAAVDADGDVDVDATVVETEESGAQIPLSALVPFANPLCDEKASKKVLKSVKKAAKNKCLKRGVKEVVKAVRKTPAAAPSNATGTPAGIVVLAADISPMDVISHLPVLCEDHNIPYVYLSSRAELGAAGSTKRPTSVVMVTPSGASGKKKEERNKEEDKEWDEAYAELNKLVVKQGQHVKV